jgi:hypothetical protein
LKHFEVEGYYFDANPFTIKRWVQRDEMIMTVSCVGQMRLPSI